MKVVIAGGGLAGAAAAIRLARAGIDVTILEREHGPKPTVCGEFLSTTALAELARLGVDPAGLGAVPLGAFALSAGRRTADVPLPFPAVSLSRERLDAHLLALAEAAGASVRRGITVRTVTDRSVETSAGRVEGAVVVATGKRDLRGHGRGDGRQPGYVGLKRYAALAPGGIAALGGTVALALLPGGYCGIQAIEDGRVNVCLAVRAERVRREGVEGVFDSLPAASAHLASMLADARWEMPTVAVGRVPYGFVRATTAGAYYVGDQAAVIPSLCGEGMGIALRTARLAAEAFVAGESAAVYQRRQAADTGPVVRGATLLARALCSPALGRIAAPFAELLPAVAAQVALAARLPAELSP